MQTISSVLAVIATEPRLSAGHHQLPQCSGLNKWLTKTYVGTLDVVPPKLRKLLTPSSVNVAANMCTDACRHLEEILGLGTMGALQGRVKRHIAAAGLSTLLLSAAFAPMFMVQRLARILAVCLRALAESKAFTVSTKSSLRSLLALLCCSAHNAP